MAQTARRIMRPSIMPGFCPMHLFEKILDHRKGIETLKPVKKFPIFLFIKRKGPPSLPSSGFASRGFAKGISLRKGRTTERDGNPKKSGCEFPVFVFIKRKGPPSLPSSGFASRGFCQCHLNSFNPAEKNKIPIAVKTPKGRKTSPKPAPSLKMLLIPSASMVKGNFWITGMLQSGKLW